MITNLGSTEMNKTYFIALFTNEELGESAYEGSYDGPVGFAAMVEDIDLTASLIKKEYGFNVEDFDNKIKSQWFPVSITKVDVNIDPPLRHRPILRFIEDKLQLPSVMDIRRRDLHSKSARAECQRLLALEWEETPALFSLPQSEVYEHKLWSSLREMINDEYVISNIIIKQVFDSLLEAFLSETNIIFRRVL